MDPSDQLLEAYIKQVLRLQDEHRKVPLKVEELNEVAKELGLSSEEIDFIDQKFQNYFYRGKGYARYQNWNKAIEEFEQGILIKPLHIDTLHQLALAYAQRWRQKGKPQDKKKAKYYAERSLQIDPQHEGAFGVMARLQSKSGYYRKREKYLRYILLSLAGILIGLFVYMAISILRNDHQHSNQGNTEIAPVKPLPATSIQVDLIQSKDQILTWQEESVILRPTASGKALDIQGYLKVGKNWELKALVLRVEVLNQARESIFIDLLNPWGVEQAPLVQGDLIPLSILMRDESFEGNLAAVFLEVYSLQGEALDEAPDLGEILPIKNREHLNPEWGIELRERSQLLRTEAESFSQQLDISVSNLSPKVLSKIEVEVQWFNKDGKLIHSVQYQFLDIHTPGLREGQRIIKRCSAIVPYKFSDFDHYEVNILELE